MNLRPGQRVSPDEVGHKMVNGAGLVNQKTAGFLEVAWSYPIGRSALLPITLSLALASWSCSALPARSRDGAEAGGAVAEAAPEQAGPAQRLPTAPAAPGRGPLVARQILDIAAYAERNGYYLKNGWWWRDDGYGVLHALFDGDAHYGIGLMMSTVTSEERTKLAINWMAAALYELELGSRFALDLTDFYKEQLSEYAEVLDAEYSSATVLHGREIEVSFWRTETQAGSAVGTLMEIEKP